uniref:DUF1937 domain-containing protein n=1 Tax=viral metagenome TaxID=1070528 RepID=A0A6M3LE83_9ZZZZ
MYEIEYLGAPYRHDNDEIRCFRAHLINIVAGNLVKQGRIIYSPITHNHPLAELFDLPKDWEFWRKYDEAFISTSKSLLIVTLPGWLDSEGLAVEAEIAEELGIQVEPLDPLNYGVSQEQIDKLQQMLDGDK